MLRSTRATFWESCFPDPVCVEVLGGCFVVDCRTSRYGRSTTSTDTSSSTRSLTGGRTRKRLTCWQALNINNMWARRPAVSVPSFLSPTKAISNDHAWSAKKVSSTRFLSLNLSILQHVIDCGLSANSVASIYCGFVVVTSGTTNLQRIHNKSK